MTWRAATARRVGLRFGIQKPAVDRIIRRLYDPDAPDDRVKTIIDTKFGLRFEVDTSSFLEWTLFVYGEYERRVREWLCDQLREGDVAIDVGANIGIHTLAMAQAVGTEGHIHAFEPFNEVRARLQRNVALNGFEDRVSVHAVALWNLDGESQAFAPDEVNRGLFHLKDGGDLRVATRRLDSLNLPRARVMKVDVEGGEGSVLAGALEYIGENAPYLAVEDTNTPTVRRLLTPFGYRLERLTSDVLAAYPRRALSEQ
jgi:FkbM family methyltransferase